METINVIAALGWGLSILALWKLWGAYKEIRVAHFLVQSILEDKLSVIIAEEKEKKGDE